MSQQWQAQVAECVAKAKALIGDRPVTRDILRQVQALLEELASQPDLFPLSEFPLAPPGDPNASARYLLHADPDQSFALYLNAINPGKKTPPHDHTTWACIAAVEGEELNRIYARPEPGVTEPLRVEREVVVRPGAGLAFMPDDIHSIHVDPAGRPTRHLHFYGRALEVLNGRSAYDLQTGQASNFNRQHMHPSRRPPKYWTAQQLHEALDDGEELALLDVRETGVYAEGHLFWAISAPLSRLELLAETLVPRRSTRIVLVDADGVLAARAAQLLQVWGYTDVGVLQGGLAAWQAAGHALFAGVNVPSKAFGEAVQHHYGTPDIGAEELARWQREGRDIVIVDSRPAEEFRAVSLPGGRHCPGGDLVWRAEALAPDPATTIVVNCAGRTRSIMGAQSLRSAGVPNRVVALRNGTMGWKLAGFELEHGRQDDAVPMPAPAQARRAGEAARAFAQAQGVRAIDVGQLAQWQQQEASSRSLFLLDVRLADEYAQGHWPGARHAPGGQLVQATDQYIGVRHARVVLLDHDGTRAWMTAGWLQQMGCHEVYVLPVPKGAPLHAGPDAPKVLRQPLPDAPVVRAAALQQALGAGQAAVIDIDNSLRFRQRHIPGALFTTRGRLPEAVAAIPAGQRIVLTSEDGVLAAVAAAELQAATGRDVASLLGGMQAWLAAGLPTESGGERVLSGYEDRWYRPYERQPGDQREAMLEYLRWEVELAEQIAREPGLSFRLGPVPAAGRIG
ncbi:rhodanese-like domain-containing protein [Caldimonas thermodepolymerans]|uniref:rhodanese-like domain-containing protein n=1 Tax=Caldimonas thermodepolymerans TaxID=215580 RepID=UPI0022356356|nr:rhodanese-like domain-containing protein [Caldimonas thermodepolymerans]UZG42677.1 rhodanese-like domain-containing protein [Caldimonas thermodepolymerans]